MAHYVGCSSESTHLGHMLRRSVFIMRAHAHIRVCTQAHAHTITTTTPTVTRKANSSPLFISALHNKQTNKQLPLTHRSSYFCSQRRLCYHLASDKLHTKQQILGVESTLPAVDHINELSELFRAQVNKKCERLRKKGTNRLLVLVVDALTQLDSFEYDAGGHDAMTHDLEWLIPESEMPSNLRIVLASLEGTPVEVLQPSLPPEHTYVHARTRTHTHTHTPSPPRPPHTTPRTATHASFIHLPTRCEQCHSLPASIVPRHTPLHTHTHSLTQGHYLLCTLHTVLKGPTKSQRHGVCAVSPVVEK
jgi:hypothetical protein